jgi:hypothetical protein
MSVFLFLNFDMKAFLDIGRLQLTNIIIMIMLVY